MRPLQTTACSAEETGEVKTLEIVRLQGIFPMKYLSVEFFVKKFSAFLADTIVNLRTFFLLVPFEYLNF